MTKIRSTVKDGGRGEPGERSAVEQRHVAEGDVFISRSGRHWRAYPSRLDRVGCVSLMPLGDGVGGGADQGGVVHRQVEVERLVKQTHGWRRAQGVR